MKSTTKTLTEGPLAKQILLVSLPLALSNLLQVLFNMSDVAVVGRFAGSTALGAVGSTSILVTLFTGFLIGLSNGINVLVARFYGARHTADVQKTVHSAAIVSLIAGVALLFIGLGLLCGSVMNVKQVGGICGALLTNLTAWLSGTWFDLELVGGAFQRIAYALPFVHAVELDRAALSGDWASVMPHLWWVLAYAAAALAAAVLLFLRQMKRQ